MPSLTLPPGRIDIHSHLLPEVDDGCRSLEESFECVRMLKAQGFVATFCTPHMSSEISDITPAQAARQTALLQEQIDAAGLDYRIWPGGELRIHPNAIRWMQIHGVPTLGPSRCVLTDYWGVNWDPCINSTLRWLKEQGFQPIFAHPERVQCPRHSLLAQLKELQAMGVWLQGNVRCITGEEGRHAKLLVEELMSQAGYQLLALDMHRPQTLPSRFEGLSQLCSVYGDQHIELLISDAPRKLILSQT